MVYAYQWYICVPELVVIWGFIMDVYSYILVMCYSPAIVIVSVCICIQYAGCACWGGVIYLLWAYICVFMIDI